MSSSDVGEPFAGRVGAAAIDHAHPPAEFLAQPRQRDGVLTRAADQQRTRRAHHVDEHLRAAATRQWVTPHLGPSVERGGARVGGEGEMQGRVVDRSFRRMACR